MSLAMREFIKALKEGTEYDYISNNAWHMDREDLASIIKEYAWAIGQSNSGRIEHYEIEDEVIKNLEEREV